MLLLVGLGNPSPNNTNNRHNVGFKVIDDINKQFGLLKQKPKFINSGKKNRSSILLCISNLIIIYYCFYW